MYIVSLSLFISSKVNKFIVSLFVHTFLVNESDSDFGEISTGDSQICTQLMLLKFIQAQDEFMWTCGFLHQINSK